MGKRKHRSRSRSSDSEDLRKRLKKLEKKLKLSEKREKEHRRPRSPGTPPPLEIDVAPTQETQQEKIISKADVEDDPVEEIPEELILALGNEGQEIENVGEDLQIQLVNSWTNIIQQGLSKEAKETILKKYPTQGNFPAAIPPTVNPEISARFSEATRKRDQRIIYRQTLVGKIMIALGKTLTNVMKGNLNTKEIVEQLNDSAKIAAEVYHQDMSSRKFFALAGKPPVIREAVKNSKPDEFLFGKTCGDLIKAAQSIQKMKSQINQGNWKSPLQPKNQLRSGPTYQTSQSNYPARQPQRYQPSQRSQTTLRPQTTRKKPPSQKAVQSRYRRH